MRAASLGTPCVGGMSSSVHVEVLRRAAEILGGKSALRALLRVPMPQLDLWMQGAARPPSYIFLRAIDLISAEPDSGSPAAVRRSIELRRKSRLLGQAARAARDNADEAFRSAASTLERSREIRASLLGLDAPLAARLRNVSAEDFAATEFASSDGRLIVDTALRAAVNSTAATRANVQLVCPAGLRIVGHIGFEPPFLDFFAIVDDRTPTCCDRALKAGGRIVVTDVRMNPIFAGTEAGDVMQHAGALACQSTPLLGASNEVIGMLSTHYEKPHRPSSKELELLDLISRRMSFWLGGRSL